MYIALYYKPLSTWSMEYGLKSDRPPHRKPVKAMQNWNDVVLAMGASSIFERGR